MDLQLLFQLVEQVEGVASLTVHLIDEDDHRRIAHAADLHQLACLSLHTFGGIDDDDSRVDGCQRTVGIFCEVLVTWRVEDVDLVWLTRLVLGQIVELHHRSRHGDTTLLLNVHPVGSCCLADLVVLHGTGHLDLSSKEKEFLGQGGLTGIRVGDDGECAPALYFVH